MTVVAILLRVRRGKARNDKTDMSRTSTPPNKNLSERVPRKLKPHKRVACSPKPLGGTISPQPPRFEKLLATVAMGNNGKYAYVHFHEKTQALLQLALETCRGHRKTNRFHQLANQHTLAIPPLLHCTVG